MLHDSSPTGKASALAAQLAAQAGRFKVRAHQQKATEAVVVDPDTLEPSHGGSSADGAGSGGGRRMGAKETSWTLHDSSATVAMTLDVIKYASRASVVVVVSARAELAETLQHLVLEEGEGEEEDGQEGGGPTVSTTGGSSSSSSSSSPPPAVYVCALGREVAGTALERWLLKPSAQQQRQLSQSAPRPVTLERVLASAAEALWTRGRQNRRTAGLCPKGTSCSHLRGTSGEAGGSSSCGVGGQGVGGNSSPRPFTAHKITHLCQFLHPCGQGQACAAVGPLHRLAFIHGGGGGAGSSTNASSSRSTLPLLPPTGSTGNRAQQLATSATLHNRLPLPHHHHAAAPNAPSRLAAPAPSRPAGATVVSRSPPLDVPAPRPTKPTGSGSLLAELALESGGTGAGPEAEAGFCMSPLSKAARQASLWWYEAHRAQQRAGVGALAGGEYEEGDGHQQEWGDEDALGREHGAIFPMSL